MEKVTRDLLTQTLLDMGVSAEFAELEIPRDEALGDLSTPVSMRLARVLKRPPTTIAGQIRESMLARGAGLFKSIDIAGQGFINLTFSDDALIAELKRLLQQQEAYCREDIGRGKRVQIEFVSANPTGPLHLGHGRGAAVGMALANLLQEVGFGVQREYYINDAGVQIEKLGQSVFARYRQLFCDEPEYPFPEDGYRGDYISELAESPEIRDFAGRSGLCYSEFKDVADTIKELSCSLMLREIKRDLTDFGVTFDSWQSERELYRSGLVQSAIAFLRSKGLIYDSEGAQWFKSAAFGDDKDRVVVKQDNQYTYFASDIAYHKQKLDRGFQEIIDLWGADHHGYIPRVSAVLQGLGLPSEGFNVLLIQMVTLLRDGRPVQMSKRAGDFVTLRELIDEIGPDTTKFLFLTRRHDTPLDIDVEKAKAQSSENPVYYVQYAYARINSIFQKAISMGIDPYEPNSISGFNEDERRLLKKALLYPMTLRSAALSREPHRIAFFLHELAGLFHPYYHKHRVITEDALLTQSRLALCNAMRIVFGHGLRILGVSIPQKM